MRVVALLLACAAAVMGADTVASPDAKPVGEGKSPAEPKTATEQRPPLDAKALAEAKSQVKALYAESQQRGDLWTALQLEAWAATQHQQLRGAPMLGATEVFGEPLFAVPEDIRTLADRGDAVEVVTNHRYHCFALDGRPLVSSVPIGVRCDRNDIAFSHGWVGAIENITKDDAPTVLAVRVTPVAKGLDGGLQSELEEAAGFNMSGDPKVADDGTALAIGMYREATADMHTVVTTAKVKRTEYAGVAQAIGVGSGGAWLLATAWDGERAAPMLIVGGERTKLRSAAMGPGIAAAITSDNGLCLIDRAGKRLPLKPGMALGGESSVITVGRWLVVASGPNAKALPTTDFLGVEVPSPGMQLPTLALYRWDDLAGEGKAPVIARYQNEFDVARNLPAALFIWRGPRIDVLDLAGPKPSIRPFCTIAKDVAWASAQRVWTRVGLKSGGSTLVDDQGRELWTADTDVGLNVWVRDTALVTKGRNSESSFDLVHLAVDPKERKVTHLDLTPTGAWTVTGDPVKQRWVAHLGKQWVYGDFSGTQLGRGMGKGSRPPEYDAVWPPNGRYTYRFGRIMLKDVGAEPLSEAEVLAPSDAWMMGRVLFVLDRDQHVLVTGHKKTGLWSDLGAVDSAGRLAVTGKEEMVVVAGYDQRVLASFTATNAGPALKLEKSTRPCDWLPEGPWRLANNRTFAPPHSGSMDWSEERAGFIALCLRSPKTDPANLLIVTSSLVIALDPAAAKLVGGTSRR